MAEKNYSEPGETIEQVAYRLMDRVLDETYVEGQQRTEKLILDAYANALQTVTGRRSTTAAIAAP